MQAFVFVREVNCQRSCCWQQPLSHFHRPHLDTIRRGGHKIEFAWLHHDLHTASTLKTIRYSLHSIKVTSLGAGALGSTVQLGSITSAAQHSHIHRARAVSALKTVRCCLHSILNQSRSQARELLWETHPHSDGQLHSDQLKMNQL